MKHQDYMKITMIGAGAMGGATVEGLLKAGHEGKDICVSDPSAEIYFNSYLEAIISINSR